MGVLLLRLPLPVSVVAAVSIGSIVSTTSIVSVAISSIVFTTSIVSVASIVSIRILILSLRFVLLILFARHSPVPSSKRHQ